MAQQDQVMEAVMAYYQREKEKKLRFFRQRNLYVKPGQLLFTGSSLMEQFPITEFCLNEGIPAAYNRGIGGYTTDEFLAAVGPMLLDPEPERSIPSVTVSVLS